jgi:hypothetical protein
MLFVISSVHKRSGLLYKKIQDCHGKDDAKTLAVMGGTTTFNPSFDQSIIDAALEDPERVGAKYLCRWRDDLSSWLDKPLLEAAVDIGVVVRPPQAGISFMAAIAHRDKDGTGARIEQALLTRGVIVFAEPTPGARLAEKR